MPSLFKTSRHLLWLGVGTAAMALVMALMLLLQLTQQQVMLQRSAVGLDSATAMTSQFDREFLRLSQTLTLYSVGVLPPDPAELALRFDIFVSRFNLLRENPSTESLAASKVYRVLMPKLAQLIEQADAELLKEQPGRTAVGELVKSMEVLLPDVQALSMAANQQVAQTIEQQGKTMMIQSDRIIALTVTQCVLLMGAAGALFFRHRRQDLEQRALKRLNEALGESRDQLEVRVTERTLELSQEVSERKEAQQELARVNGQIAAVSHRAGMAEVANSVLHNVGNVLNSVNVSVFLLSERLKHTPLVDFPQATALMLAHESDLVDYLTRDDQGRQLPGFLGLLSQHWAMEQHVMLTEVAHLKSNVLQIKEIVSRQQSLSGHSAVIETFNVAEVINDALTIHGNALECSAVNVETGMQGLVWRGDRSKFAQIILNLVVNAEEALAVAHAKGRLLKIDSSLGEDGVLIVKVADNGAGMAVATLEKLFSYGFTTKIKGHGFGLHASALAAQEMGGSLKAFSDGENQGALFVLSLPPTS